MPAETMTLVVYDIPHDRTRFKVSETCLDYGLVRIQYSVFQGLLTRSRREELALRFDKLIEKRGGAILLFPLCQADLAARISLFVEPPADSAPVLTLFRAPDDGDDDDDPAN